MQAACCRIVLFEAYRCQTFFSGSGTCAEGYEHICVKTDDSYKCKCKTGYVLNPKRKTSIRKNPQSASQHKKNVQLFSHFCFS